MKRITIRTLRDFARIIARETGAPDKGIGSLHVQPGSQNNGISWELYRVTNEHGGVTRVLRSNTALGLYDQMDAYVKGWRDAKENQQ